MVKHPKDRLERLLVNSKKTKKEKDKKMEPILKEIQLTVSKDNLNNQVGAMLYAWGVVKDSEEIVDIKFDGQIDGLVPMRIYLQEELSPKSSREGSKALN